MAVTTIATGIALMITTLGGAAQPVTPGSSPCSPAETELTRQAGVEVDRGDDGSAVARLIGRGGDGCAELLVARFALAAWIEARRVASGGGARELLAPIESALSELRAATTDGLTLESDYAQAAVRAAVAAAQDERDEMSLWLTHARDLAERLSTRSRRAVWPRSFNVLAGELWLEVDRYEDARLAFERAVHAAPTPLALVGQATTLARLDRKAEACDLLRQVRDAAPALLARARAEVPACQPR